MKNINLKTKFATICKNGGLFLLLLLVTFYMIFRETEPGQIMAAVSQADIRYLLAAACAMGIFLLGEGINIGRCLHLLDEGQRVFSGIKYAVAGFFGSSVTPSASGGQPLQLYFMHRDGVNLSHGTLALLLELLSYQIVTVTLAVTGFFAVQGEIAETIGNMRILLLLGVGINAVAMVFLICAIFCEHLADKIVSFLVKLIKKYNKEKGMRLETSLRTALLEYQRSAVYLKENKTIFLKTIATTAVQMIAMYSIPYWIYLSLGLSGYSAFHVILLQAVLFGSVSALPLPGAMGVSEGAFSVLFQTLFTGGLLPGAMVLSRIMSFYLPLAVSVICVLLFSKKRAICPKIVPNRENGADGSGLQL